ncbi:hypothetical protein Acr_13g0015320 [Actinidia rufa]|uniref:Uncharacterized protein n=1 Tax=Actinidia rufa TaxID=165716 RepID=A0A7J0FN30_9ERIC|nr:hypothetical protein Acr_13g0015110 [Actinidia rufa]GFZ00133.1 hypothetical protein Acr_13g0015320 [Actinidia rufa]
MLLVSCQPQGADDTEDVIKAKNHISRSSAPSLGESDGSPLGGTTVVTTRESSPSRNRRESGPPEQSSSGLAWLVNGDKGVIKKMVLMMEIILHVKVMLYGTSLHLEMSNTSPVADETSRLSRQATSNEHFACSNSSLVVGVDECHGTANKSGLHNVLHFCITCTCCISLFSDLGTAVNFLWGFIFLIILMAGICDAFLLQGLCAAPTRCDNAAVERYA